MKNDPSKPVLVPISVPWQVSPSTPAIKCVISENAGAHLIFAAGNGPLFTRNSGSQALMQRGHNPAQIAVFDTGNLSRYVVPYPTDEFIVRLDFARAGWVNSAPINFEEERMQSDYYDLSNLKIQYTRGASISEYLQSFAEEWKQSGICPDPGFYEIQNSPWIAAAQASRYGCKHFLVKGHDMYVELLGNGYSWKQLGYLEW